MRKSKIILSLLIISLLASRACTVKAVNPEVGETSLETGITTQADDTTDTTERSLVFTPSYKYR